MVVICQTKDFSSDELKASVRGLKEKR